MDNNTPIPNTTIPVAVNTQPIDNKKSGRLLRSTLFVMALTTAWQLKDLISPNDFPLYFSIYSYLSVVVSLLAIFWIYKYKKMGLYLFITVYVLDMVVGLFYFLSSEQVTNEGTLGYIALGTLYLLMFVFLLFVIFVVRREWKNFR